MSRHYYNLITNKTEKYVGVGKRRPANGWTQEKVNRRAGKLELQKYCWVGYAAATSESSWMGELSQGRVPQTYQAAEWPQ